MIDISPKAPIVNLAEFDVSAELDKQFLQFVLGEKPFVVVGEEEVFGVESLKKGAKCFVGD